jgi:DNA-binding PadR family transcriptional regulator
MRVKNYQRLRELNDLFGHRGDAQVIISLAGYPSLRNAELGRAITAHTGERFSDTEINRCLHRLEANGLLIGDGPRRHKTYRLTRRGQAKAAMLTCILDALDGRDDETPDTQTMIEEPLARKVGDRIGTGCMRMIDKGRSDPTGGADG